MEKQIMMIGYYHHNQTILLTGGNMTYQITVTEQLLELLIIRKDMLTTYEQIENEITGLHKGYAPVIIFKLRKQYHIEQVKGKGIIYRGRIQEKI